MSDRIGQIGKPTCWKYGHEGGRLKEGSTSRRYCVYCGKLLDNAGEAIE